MFLEKLKPVSLLLCLRVMEKMTLFFVAIRKGNVSPETRCVALCTKVACATLQMCCLYVSALAEQRAHSLSYTHLNTQPAQ